MQKLLPVAISIFDDTHPISIIENRMCIFSESIQNDLKTILKETQISQIITLAEVRLESWGEERDYALKTFFLECVILRLKHETMTHDQIVKSFEGCSKELRIHFQDAMKVFILTNYTTIINVKKQYFPSDVQTDIDKIMRIEEIPAIKEIADERFENWDSIITMATKTDFLRIVILRLMQERMTKTQIMKTLF